MSGNHQNGTVNGHDAQDEKIKARNRRLMILALWVPLLFTLVLGYLTYQGQRIRDLDSQWVLHTALVRNQIGYLNSLVVDVETSERGYLLTENTNFLSPYDNALQKIPDQIQSLALLIADNPKQVAAVARLQNLIADKLSVAAQSLVLARQGNLPGAIQIVATGRGKQIMDEIRPLINVMDAEEDRLLVIREKTFTSQANFQNNLMIGLVSVDIALIMGATFLMLRLQRLRRNAVTQTELAEARNDLTLRASELSYRRLFEAAKDGILILDVGTGRITDVNPFLFHLLGFSRDEMMGKTVGELSPFKDIEENKVMLSRLQKDGYVRYEDLPMETRDGRHIAVEFVSNVYKAGDENVIQCNVRDITERKRIEARFQRLLNSNVQGVAFWNAKGGFTDANDAFLGIVGYDRDEMKAGRISWTAMTPPEFVHLDQNSLKEMSAKGFNTPYEKEFFRKDGSRVPVLVGAATFEDNPDEGVCFVLDITDRRRTEIALRENEQRLRDILDTMFVFVGLMNLDGLIVEVNHAPLEAAGLKRADVLGKTIAESYWFSHSPAVQEHVRQSVARAALGEIMRDDYLIRIANGAHITIDTTFAPLRDSSGRVTQIVGSAVDITQRKQAEEKIQLLNSELEQRVIKRTAQLEATNEELLNEITERKKTEDELTTSFKEIGDLRAALDEHAIVAITDPQGKITFANDKFCSISKYSREELLGHDHRLINSGFHPKEFIRELWTTILSGKVWQGEIKNKAKDGSFYWVDTTIVPFLDELGKIRQFVAIRADITKRKTAEERVIERTVQLEAANKELEAFSYSVSHDLRAPLRAVNGFAGIALEDFGAQLPEECRRYLERIRGGALRMGELIDDLLKFSRLSRQTVSLQPVNSARIVQEVLDELKPQRDGRQIEIKIGELHVCQGDPSLLKQVWVNLISNAIKYTRGREPAIIEIGCMEEVESREPSVESQTATPSTLDPRPSTVFFVRDNGAGFDMKYANKLFGVFQRLHSENQFEGTGVGLAIVQRIVHRHGGRVWAKAEVNRGATFYFTIGETKL